MKHQHIFGVLFHFGVKNLFNSKPIYNHDYPYHLYNCYQSSHYYAQGESWGYNPFFNAGYPSGISLDNDLFQLLCFYCSFLGNSILLMKIWLCFILILAPLFIYYSSRNFKFDEKTSLISTILCLLYLYNDPFLNSVIYFGMFNFLFLCFLSVFLLSLLFRYTYDSSRNLHLLLIIFLPLAMFIHSASMLCFPLLFVAFYAGNSKKVSIYQHLFILILLGSSLIIFFRCIGLPYIAQSKKYIIYDSSSYLFQIENIKNQ